MAFPEGWDRLNLLTLRFVDPELERAYQHADLAEGVRRVRTASLSAIVVWVLVGVIGPPALGVPSARVWPISGVMIAVLLFSAVLSRWAPRAQGKSRAVEVYQLVGLRDDDQVDPI